MKPDNTMFANLGRGLTPLAKAKSPAATTDWGTPDPRDADAYPKHIRQRR